MMVHQNMFVKKVTQLLLIILFFGYSTVTVDSLAEAQSLKYTKGELQKTKYGSVQGFLEANTLVWTGIPYAKAPVGPLRWRAPQFPEKWEGVFDATKFGNIGIQAAGGKIVGSEDSLNINIYRPNTEEIDLPVFVFIHGGNNQVGSNKQLQGQVLAKETNAVIVTINHRLGPLGFINLPALKTGDKLEDSGNFALLDMAKSLDWIKENIAAFGGNGGNITISGYSAGGRNVMAMLISPIFKGKFQKAISFSGGMTITNYEAGQVVDAHALAPLVVKDGVKPNVEEAVAWLQNPSNEVREYLYNLPSERLAPLMGGAGIRMSVFPHLFADGAVLPKEGFDSNSYAVNVPLIMLTGRTEFKTFARLDKYFTRDGRDKIFIEPKKSEYVFATKYGSALYSLFNTEESATRMFAAYKAPIYLCEIAYGADAAIVGEKMAHEFGAYHGVFLPLLSGSLSLAAAAHPESFTTVGVEKLSKVFRSYIKQFIWTGSPNGLGLTPWEEWSNKQGAPSQLVFDADKNKAIISMTTKRISYGSVILEIEKDTSITPEAKKIIISQVLNGRWFSNKLDTHFKTPSLWK